MNEDDLKNPSEGEKPQRLSWREQLLGPRRRLVITFVIGQLLELVVKLLHPDSIERLRDLNNQLTAGVKQVQPWYAAAIFWERLTSSWPQAHSPTDILSFLLSLLGRIVSSGIEAIALPLSGGWETALPAFVGYGLGLYITWLLFAKPNDNLNLIIGIVGTILIGGLCLLLLQPLMIMITVIFNQLLGTVAAGSTFLISFLPPIIGEFIKHIIQHRAEARLEKALKSSGNSARNSASVKQQQINAKIDEK